MRPPGRAGRILLVAGCLVVLGGVGGWLWLRGELRDSLPQLEGEIALPGLTEPVTIERDGLGVPTIRAANLVDLSQAIGFVHAQDRFFQMDLQRRSAAGERATRNSDNLINVGLRSRGVWLCHQQHESPICIPARW